MKSQFERLVDWYCSQCNGLWEHQHHGFTISTLDNPALRLRVDVNETRLQDASFDKVEHNFSSDDEWLACEKTSDNFFDGCAPPHLFGQVIEIFLDWSRQQARGRENE